MFTVKATYRGETRKFTFPECNSFPSFDQLYHQLYRVFPISHNFFLSKLLFSPDSSKSRVLVSREVRTSEEYASCVAPFLGKPWSNPLLRFSVFDETPHKQPNLSGSRSLPQLRVSNPQTPSAPLYTVPVPPPVNTMPFGPISFSHIPPPPIIFSTAPSCPQAQDLMDVDSSVPGHDHGKMLTFPQPPEPHNAIPKPVSCCAVAQTKTDIQALITDFKTDLDRIITSFATTKSEPEALPKEPAPAPASVPPAPVEPVYPPLCQFNFCWRCGVIKRGPWFDCVKCANKLCTTCHENATTMDCFVGTGPHVWKRQTCPHCPESSAPLLGVTSAGPAWDSSSLISLESSSLPSVPTMPPVTKAEPSVDNSTSPPPPATEAPVVNESPVDAAPVIHHGVACDVCHFTIAGVRHKCLDCPDYDLCSSCISSGSAERHNPFHEFIELAEPGRVIVHNVLSGRGERDAVQPNSRRSPGTPTARTTAEPVMHNATCNMCDSRIRGDRYKCLNCPDYDVCGFCFTITEEQHPNHGFVKLSQPDDFIRRGPSNFAPRHLASCDSCSRPICGVRYKCMHPECPDFDLCENCEALPIPVHPINHPMLKLKVSTTMIPTVYRVGQGVQTHTPVPEVPRGRPVSRVASPGARSRSGSYEDGYLRNPTARNGYQVVGISTPEYPPLSPFYFKSETSRSRSRSPRPEQRSPSPFLPPSSPPMQIPGGLPTAYTLPPLLIPRSLSPILSSAEREPSPLSPILKAAEEEAEKQLSPFWKHMYQPGSSVVVPGQYTPPRSPSPYPLTMNAGAGLASRERSLSPRPSTPEWRPVLEYSPPGQFPVKLPSSRSSTTMRSEEQRSADVVRALPPVEVTTMATGFWPENFQEIRHLMEDEPSFSRDLGWSVAQAGAAPVEESPLIAEGEPLLNRPASADKVEDSNRSVPSLASILSGNNPFVTSEEEQVPPLLSVNNPFVTSEEEHVPPPPAPAAVSLPPVTPTPLRAEFVQDRSVPEGQVFPPGAEFMKSWSMLNDGDRPWPESTELVFVAGDSLAKDADAGKPVKVGAVEPLQQIDLWTGELKAPDVPGRYVSYYRLRDGEGKLFGNSIWLDITVSETPDVSSGSEEYLSSSSVIVMPKSADQDGLSGNSTVPSSPVTARSSTSLVSVPEESEVDSDEELWEDSRGSVMVQGNEATRGDGEVDEYVVLYETTSEEE